jgi:AraC-like DNA-binding protein
MADDLNQRGQQDRSRINMNEPWEVKYWTRELGVSQEELARIVRVAGNSVSAVRQHIKH